jgi:PIN domain nuclease of toxin-antitoxin system
MIWLLNGSRLKESAIIEIAWAQVASSLYVSPISAWEAGLALQKSQVNKRPDLNGQDAAKWFSSGYRALDAKAIPIKFRIAVEAYRVPAIAGNIDIRDPGDCYIIATARVRKLTLVTRDKKILKLAKRQPDYLTALAC